MKIFQWNGFSDEEIKTFFNLSPGASTFAVCYICGLLRWTSTRTNAPTAIEYVRDEGQCSFCEDAARRSPEVAMWVMALFAFKAFKATK